MFQKPSAITGEGPLLANSTVVTYLGLDQREGLVSIAKQLLQSRSFCTSPVSFKLLKYLYRNRAWCVERHMEKVLSR